MNSAIHNSAELDRAAKDARPEEPYVTLQPTSSHRQSLFRRFFLSTFVLLLTALCIAPYTSPPPPPEWNSLLPRYSRQRERSSTLRALILTAHPDDECMFFSPTILSLVDQQAHIQALCLSSGNATGIGNLRSEELLSSYTTLGVNKSDVTIVNNIDLPDTMQLAWNPIAIASVLVHYLEAHPVDIIITFDTGGITQHPNHTPLSLGVKLSFAQLTQRDPANDSHSSRQRPRLLTLETVPKHVKFTSVLFPLYKSVDYRLRKWISSIREEPSAPDSPMILDITSSRGGYLTALRAMMQHGSQLVWFRWLYVAFSKYMWSNRLVEVKL